MFRPKFKKAHPVFCKVCDKLDVFLTDNFIHIAVAVGVVGWIINIISHRGM